MKKFLLLFSLTFLFISCSSENDNRHVTDAIQGVVDAHYAAAVNKSGISVAVYRDGYIWTYAAGDAGWDIPMTTSTPSYAYSITKTMVSALVLTQIEAGYYTLNNTVDELLNDNADYLSLSALQKALLNTNATVAQLLSHTSGMPDYATNITPLLGLCDPSKTWKPSDILEKLVNKPLAAPGEFLYSNTNYVLLGMIAEHKGGAALNTLLSSAFFAPLGLDIKLGPQDSTPDNIALPYDDAAIFGLQAGSFTYLTYALSVFYPQYNFFLGVGRSTWAAGGIMSTAENIARWGYELYDADGDAVTEGVRAVLKDSAPSGGDYGYGVSYDDFTYNEGTAGGRYGHGGSAPGYKTLLVYETSRRISVAIMTNANNIYGMIADPSASDSELGLIDRDSLADAILNACNDNK